MKSVEMSDVRKILVDVDVLEALLDQYDPLGDIAKDDDAQWVRDLRKGITEARVAK